MKTAVITQIWHQFCIDKL